MGVVHWGHGECSAVWVACIVYVVPCRWNDCGYGIARMQHNLWRCSTGTLERRLQTSTKAADEETHSHTAKIAASWRKGSHGKSGRKLTEGQ